MPHIASEAVQRRLEESGDEDRRLRDVVALSTLPAIWLQAHPLRVAESLAAALFATVAPALMYVGLRDRPDEDFAAAAQMGRNETDPAVAAAIGPILHEWAREHDPEDYIALPDPVGPATLTVTTRPLGHGAELGVIAAGFSTDRPPDKFEHIMLNVAATQAATAVQNMRLLHSLRQTIAEKAESEARERRSREETEALQQVALTLVVELDLKKLMQRLTDAMTRLSGAKYGAFFYNVNDNQGGSYSLFTLSGMPREAFAEHGLPRKTALFEPTFLGQGVVRLDDVHADQRYGRSPPHFGMPKGHPPVRSYMAVPIVSRSGDVLGGLFLGHPDAGVFTERAERLVVGIGAQAAIAIDNARLYQRAQDEIAARKRHEAHQKMLLDELNHRVKNTLASIQSIAMRTLKGSAPIAEERQTFQARLAALAKVHDLLTAANWEGASLHEVVAGPLAPYVAGDDERFVVEGPPVHLRPRAALALGMAFHELATNAAKYGALSKSGGRVRVSWEVDQAAQARLIRLRWTELGGPLVAAPDQRGFGTTLIERGLAYDLGGDAQLSFEPQGVVCRIELPLDDGPEP